jgi:hypothetical protein
MFNKPILFNRLHKKDGKVVQMQKKDKKQQARELVSLS